MDELKSLQNIYIHHKTDPIDKALCKYMNKYTAELEKISVMFIRVLHGVYKFGSLRVFVKLDTDDQLYVKNDGGY